MKFDSIYLKFLVLIKFLKSKAWEGYKQRKKHIQSNSNQVWVKCLGTITLSKLAFGGKQNLFQASVL